METRTNAITAKGIIEEVYTTLCERNQSEHLEFTKKLFEPVSAGNFFYTSANLIDLNGKALALVFGERVIPSIEREGWVAGISAYPLPALSLNQNIIQDQIERRIGDSSLAEQLKYSLLLVDNNGDFGISAKSTFGESLDSLVTKPILDFQATKSTPSPKVSTLPLNLAIPATFYQTLAIPLADAVERVLSNPGR